jgi:hypothetical protein
MTLKDANAYTYVNIQKIFECEIICSQQGVKCKGANFYDYGGRDYVCELLAEVPVNITETHLKYRKNSKLIVKIGKRTRTIYVINIT